MHAVKDWASQRPEKRSEKHNNFPLVTRALRKLTVCAASLLLERFDRTMEKIRRSSLVEDMTSLRHRGFNANHLKDIQLQKADSTPLTALKKLKFLIFGSPPFRFILHQIHVYVLPALPTSKPNKLLLTEDVSLSAQFWEMVINLVYVESAVLHASLSDGERIQLVERFNYLDDPLILIFIMHSVSAQGVNLDRCCNRVIVATNAINAPLEWQSWGQVIRVLALRV